MLASGFYQLFKSWREDGQVAAGPTALATLVAFAVGYVMIVAFLKVVATHSYLPFVYYRIVLGILVFGLLAAEILTPL